MYLLLPQILNLKKNLKDILLIFKKKKRIMIELGNIDPLDIVPTATRFPYSDAETLSYIKKIKIRLILKFSKFQNIDLNSATIIYVISKKDIDRFKFPNKGLSLKRNQTPIKIQKLRFRNNINSNNDYLPKYNNINIDQVFDSYNYVLTIPTFPFSILGNTLRGATGFRDMMSNPPSGYTAEDVVEDLYEIQGEKTAEQEELLNLIKERLI